MGVKSVLSWNGDMSFDVELQGHWFSVDANEEFGGKNRGPRPKSLLLSGLGGCTGMDVVSLLKKMKMPFDGFSLEVEGEAAEEHPKSYTTITIKYIFKGDKLDPDKIKKAIDLSLQKYCGVYAMLSKTAQISHQVILNPV
jgi:putative redox protein